MMTRDQLRQHALSTVRKFGHDCVALGRVPALKEEELLVFIDLLIDRLYGLVPDARDVERAKSVRAAGGVVPYVG